VLRAAIAFKQELQVVIDNADYFPHNSGYVDEQFPLQHYFFYVQVGEE
jgi:hypothetical protein